MLSPAIHDGTNLPPARILSVKGGSKFQILNVQRKQLTDRKVGSSAAGQEPDSPLCDGVDDLAALFCGSCGCPMTVRLRHEPCFHVSCFECVSSQADTPGLTYPCPICSEEVTTTSLLHPSDELYWCTLCAVDYAEQKLKSQEAVSQSILNPSVLRHWRPGFLNKVSLEQHQFVAHNGRTYLSLFRENNPVWGQVLRNFSFRRPTALQHPVEAGHPGWSSSAVASSKAILTSTTTSMREPSQPGTDVNAACHHPSASTHPVLSTSSSSQSASAHRQQTGALPPQQQASYTGHLPAQARNQSPVRFQPQSQTQSQPQQVSQRTSRQQQEQDVLGRPPPQQNSYLPQHHNIEPSDRPSVTPQMSQSAQALSQSAPAPAAAQSLARIEPSHLPAVAQQAYHHQDYSRPSPVQPDSRHGSDFHFQPSNPSQDVFENSFKPIGPTRMSGTQSGLSGTQSGSSGTQNEISGTQAAPLEGAQRDPFAQPHSSQTLVPQMSWNVGSGAVSASFNNYSTQLQLQSQQQQQLQQLQQHQHQHQQQLSNNSNNIFQPAGVSKSSFAPTGLQAPVDDEEDDLEDLLI